MARSEIRLSAAAAVLGCAWIALVAVPMVHAQVAEAKNEAKRPAPAVTVHADGDASLSGETPVNTPDAPDPTDISLEGSPVNVVRPAVWIRTNTPLKIKLNQPVNSGAQRNGDTLMGILLAPVKTSNGSLLSAGTPVKATVLSSARAGQLQSAGILSLQVFQVGNIPVISNVLEFSGQEGSREVADANPDKGTEAQVQAGVALNFEVLGSGDKPDPTEQPAPEAAAVLPELSQRGRAPSGRRLALPAQRPAARPPLPSMA